MKNSERFWLHLLILWFWLDQFKESGPPTGTAFQWMIAILLVPQVFISLYYLILTCLEPLKWTKEPVLNKEHNQ